MNIFEERFLKKEIEDNKLVESAKKALLNTEISIEKYGILDSNKLVMEYFLTSLGFKVTNISNYHSVEEILDLLLDPLCIMYEKVKLDYNTIKNQSNYILSYLEDGTPVIIKNGIFFNKIYVDYLREEKKPFKKETKLKEDGYIIYKTLNKDKFSLINFLKLMLSFVKFKDFLLILLCSLLIMLFGMVFPFITKSILDGITNLKDLNELGRLFLTFGLSFIFASFARIIFNVLKTFLLNKTKIDVVNNTQAAVMSKLLLLPYDYFYNKPVGRIANQVSNGKKLAELLFNFIFNTLFTFLFSIGYLFQISSFASSLILPTFIIIVLQVLINLLISIAYAKNYKKVIEKEQNSNAFIYESVSGINKIIGVGAEKRVFSKLANDYAEVLHVKFNPSFWVKTSNIISASLFTIGNITLLILAVQHYISSTDYIAFTTAFSLISVAVKELIEINSQLLSMTPIIEQLKNLFDFESREQTAEEYVNYLKGDIEINHLSFSYKKGTRGCVNDISLKIKAGEKIAIVGESGCGKSTLLKLLIGMITPDEGNILYDNKVSSTLHSRSLKKHIGSIFQFTTVFSGTIYQNVTFTSGDISQEKVWEALDKAAIKEDIEKMPFGIETEILEGRGGGFSGGQKQRLVLSRIFAQNPSVVFLDEATSALDNISQNKVLDSIYNLKSTVIMVAHRLSTITRCDRIIVLDKGKIVEMGTYKELINKNDFFASLVKKQQNEEKENS